MLQAFVSLKHQQPPRTESGLQSFFESLVAASYSPPTYFCTNVDATPVPFTAESAMRACLDDKVKFAVVRGEEPYYWQATVLMPDKTGLGAMFYDLEREGGTGTPTVEAITDFATKLYKRLEPRLIRIGDSEAREKLKSRHGLVLMPGLGRIEWLQVVHPDVYSELYNPSELVAAPAFQTDIWEDGALYLRVYGDPKDWDNEENISLANFIPGFLAGTANVQDGEKEKQNVRTIEKLWNRAQKTAERAAGIFAPPGAGAAPAPAAASPSKPAAAPVKPAAEVKKPVSAPVAPATAPAAEVKKPVSQPAAAAEPLDTALAVAAVEPEPLKPAAEPEPLEVEPLEAEPTEAEPEPLEAEPLEAEAAEVEPEPAEVETEPAEVEAEPAEVEAAEPVAAPEPAEIAALVADGGELQLADDSVERVDDADLVQPVYAATDSESDSTVYIGYGADENALRLLDKLEDFAAFLQGEGLNVSDADKDAIVRCVQTYHRPYLVYLRDIAEVPAPEGDDPRLVEFRDQVEAPYLDVSDETQQLHVWAFNPRNSSLEEILIRQFEDWPLTMEVKRHLLDLKAPTVSSDVHDVADSGSTSARSRRDDDVSSGDAAAAADTSTGDEQEKKSSMGLLFVLLLVLAIFAAVFFLVFDGDISKMMGK